jgi:glycolate oxidase iron-sulfur subunit
MARERIAALEGADLVVIDAAGCSAHVKEYGHLLADEPEWAERPLGPVAVHDACHHVHAQGIAAEPRGMLRAAGAEPVEVPNGARCCGAAGLYSVLQPELSGELRRQKAEAIASTGAPVVSVANPGCAIQIAAGLRELGVATEVRHPAELVATRPRRPHGRVRGPLGRLRRR